MGQIFNEANLKATRNLIFNKFLLLLFCSPALTHCAKIRFTEIENKSKYATETQADNSSADNSSMDAYDINDSLDNPGPTPTPIHSNAGVGKDEPVVVRPPRLTSTPSPTPTIKPAPTVKPTASFRPTATPKPTASSRPVVTPTPTPALAPVCLLPNGSSVLNGSFNEPAGFTAASVEIGESCQQDSYQGNCYNGIITYTHKPSSLNCSPKVCSAYPLNQYEIPSDSLHRAIFITSYEGGNISHSAKPGTPVIVVIGTGSSEKITLWLNSYHRVNWVVKDPNSRITKLLNSSYDSGSLITINDIAQTVIRSDVYSRTSRFYEYVKQASGGQLNGDSSPFYEGKNFIYPADSRTNSFNVLDFMDLASQETQVTIKAIYGKYNNCDGQPINIP